jgi:hypothetical protein
MTNHYVESSESFSLNLGKTRNGLYTRISYKNEYEEICLEFVSLNVHVCISSNAADIEMSGCHNGNIILDVL